MKRIRRVFARLSVLTMLVVLGAIAIAQAQRGVDKRQDSSSELQPAPVLQADDVVQAQPLNKTFSKLAVVVDSLNSPQVNEQNSQSPLPELVDSSRNVDESVALVRTQAEEGPSTVLAAATDRPNEQGRKVMNPYRSPERVYRDPAPVEFETTTNEPPPLIETDDELDAFSIPDSLEQTPEEWPPQAENQFDRPVPGQQQAPMDSVETEQGFVPQLLGAANSSEGNSVESNTTSATGFPIPDDNLVPSTVLTNPSPVSVNPSTFGAETNAVALPEFEPQQEATSEKTLRSPPAVPVYESAQTLLPTRPQSVGVAVPVDTAGRGKPGNKDLEGPQTPTLTLEKTAPPEAQVGTPITFVTRLRNIGLTTAQKVLVRDEVPLGTRLVETTPQAAQAADGAILWQLGALPAGEEVNIRMKVVPTDEGPIGSVATVSFQATASASTNSTKPMLRISHSCPRKVLIGETVTFTIELSNPGSGTTNNVALLEDVPSGLSHSAGSELEYEVGSIRPGETRRLELTLQAARAGIVENTLVARADSQLEARHSISLEVVSPQLQVDINGPKKRYLDRPATYTVSVANPGTAAANELELVAYLPQGLQFVNTNNAGEYDSRDHTVRWSLAQLPAGEKGQVQFTALPKEMGQLKLRAEGKALLGLADEIEYPLQVEGLAALFFGVKDMSDPIEVGGQMTYEIRVENQGSKTATNLRLVAHLPAGLRPLGGDGPTRGLVDGQRIVFEPIARLAAKNETVYQVHAQGVSPGDQRIRVQMTSDGVSAPVTKEESTRVYADQ